ncbi:MAG: ROK family transcriptional regulator [Planctomycetaceae bacterium]
MRIGDESARDLQSSLVRQLRIVRNISRIELSRRLDLAPSTVGQYVDRLIDDGFLREGRKTVQPAGRPPTVLELNPSAGHFVGVDFEGRQLWVVVVDFAQQPLSYRKTPIRTTDTADRVISKIENAVAASSEGHGPLLGIGVGVPGVVDTQRGVGLHYQFIRGWNEIPLRQRLADRFQVPVHLENNIRAMALAEELFGQGRGVSDFVCLGIRSGIAAGVVIDGRLHSGLRNLAGEIGGWPCAGGSTLEQLASLSALAAVLEEAVRAGKSTSLRLKRNRAQLEDVLRAAREGDGLVLDVLRHAGQVVGKVVAQLSLLLNPERVIVAGPLAEFETEFIRTIRETLEPLAPPPHAMLPVVSGSDLGEFSGALGGAALAVRRWAPVRNTN